MRPEAPSDPPPRSVDLPQGTASFTDEGDGPPIVLIHGMPGSGRDFRWLAPALSPRFRVIRLDLPGFGATPAGRTGYSIAARAAFVTAFLEALDLQGVVLVGHSMGGPVATRASLDEERVVGLALVAAVGPTPHRPLRRSPGVPLAGWLLHVPGAIGLFLPWMRRAFASVGFRGTPDGEIVQTVFVLSRFRFVHHRANLAGCRVPCMVAWCADDPVVEAAIAEKLYWASPIGPRVCFPTGGHNLQATRALELAEALGAWSDSISEG